MKRPPATLIAHWYAKLRASGFVDIEGGRDLNQLHASTFRGGDGTHGAAVLQWVDGFEPQQTLAAHATAVYFRELEHAAQQLRGQHRQLVLAASMGNAAAAGRTMGRTRRRAAETTQRFAVKIGLRREVHAG